MRHSRYRAWRFTHPDFDAGDRDTGISTDLSGSIAMAEDVASVRQSLQLLLTTRPGERVMRPGYGCQLHELAFAPNDDTTAGLAIYYVRQAIRRWEPRVEIVDLDANRDEGSPSRLNVLLEFLVRPHASRQQVRLSVDLASPEA